MDYLPQEDYLSIAQTLPVGGKGQYAHNCGDGKKLLVEHTPEAYKAYCYRCGISGWTPIRLSLAERIERLKAQKAADEEVAFSPRPPMPPIFDVDQWPSYAKVWLYKAGLSKQWISDLGFYWHERSERVVMPVLNEQSELVFWQARGFQAGRAKYLSQPLPTHIMKPVFKSAVTASEPASDLGVLCITEDILSAVRVGQCTETWSILGTSLSDAAANLIRETGKPVRVWLDGDEAGIKGRRKIIPQLRALGVDAKAIRSELDPKFYSQEEIQAYVAS
jgi:hypothetical protein